MYQRIWGEQMMGQFSSMRGNLVNLFKSMIIDWVLFEIYCDIFVFSLLLFLLTRVQKYSLFCLLEEAPLFTPESFPTMTQIVLYIACNMQSSFFLDAYEE